MVFFYRNAVAPFSPGLAASPTLERTEIPFNRKAVASFPRLIKARNRLAVGYSPNRVNFGNLDEDSLNSALTGRCL